ncbi:RmlC-like cupin [Lophiostoma macrostomum CBS 122681]|uniref:RmlC-like cupin n=1 Tax=Lophiostoma macrostomum CBS 122681 TaxID=1314788 RepID=A0A6A6TDN6_9PLEO|nr:RmlC-like cupin [Lophiostoma macrostomum CBS 122681]
MASPQRPTATTTKPVVLSPAAISAREPERFPPDTKGGNVTWKTLVSSPQTPTDTFSSGIATCEGGGEGHLELHRHAHAEIYHVISGRGVVIIDGREYDVEKGSVVYIPGDAEHGVRCVGEEDLVWLYVFAADRFGDVVYRFSGDEKKRLGKL